MPNLALYLPQGVSRLQKNVLQFVLQSSAERTRTFPNKHIRQRLRSIRVTVSNATFSSSLIHLEERSWIERLSSSLRGSVGRPTKTSAVRLTIEGRLAAHTLNVNC
jgi:hypothetical protein